MLSITQDNPSGRKKTSGLEKLDQFCARGILGLVLVILAWGLLAYGAVQIGHEYGEAKHLYGYLVIQGLVALALLLWVARIFMQRPFRLLWPPICWAVTAFVLYALVRSQFVVVNYAAGRELMNVALYASLFFLVVNNLNRRESALAVAMVLIATGLGESLFAFYQFASHNPKVWQVYKPAYYILRGSGTYIGPDSFAGFIDMVLPLALAYTVMGRLSATMKVLTGYGALVMIVGVLVSESRGGIIAMAAMLVAFCAVLLWQKEYWKKQGLVALGVLLVAGVVLLQQFGAVQERFEKAVSEKGDERMQYWNGAEQIFHQHLTWGAGPAQFKYLYPPYTQFLGDYGETFPQTAHNDYLNTLCEWGLAGFALILAALGLLYAGVFQFWPYVKRTPNELERKHSSKAAFVLGASLGLLAMLIHSAVDFDMHVPANAVVAVTLMALLTAHWRFGTEGYWFNPRKFGKGLLALVILGTAGYLGVAGAKAAREFYWFEQGEAKKTPWSEQVTDFKKARELEPRNYWAACEIGDVYLFLARQGEADYQKQTLEAMKWFQEAMILNPYDSVSCLGYGMCLDWLGRRQEATAYFVRADELRPYNSMVYMDFGQHCLELRNYAMAAHFFELSAVFAHGGEGVHYYKLAMQRMQDAAKGLP